MAYKGKPCPPIEEFMNSARQTRFAVDIKIWGAVAVECQLRCGVPLDAARRNTVGRKPDAVRRLKNFRYNMLEKNTPKGVFGRRGKARTGCSSDGEKAKNSNDAWLRRRSGMRGSYPYRRTEYLRVQKKETPRPTGIGPGPRRFMMNQPNLAKPLRI